MWVKSYSKVYQGVSKESIWHKWADIKSWPKWDKGLESCTAEVNFSFTAGAYFYLKPLGGPQVKIKLIEVIDNYKFVDCCNFFGATMYDTHILEETKNGLRITNTITVKGPLSFLWVKLVAKNIANSIPEQTEALVSYTLSETHD